MVHLLRQRYRGTDSIAGDRECSDRETDRQTDRQTNRSSV